MSLLPLVSECQITRWKIKSLKKIGEKQWRNRIRVGRSLMVQENEEGQCPVTLKVAQPWTLSNRKQLRHVVITESSGQRNKLRSCWYTKKTAGREEYDVEEETTWNEGNMKSFVTHFAELIPETELCWYRLKQMQINRTQSLRKIIGWRCRTY